MSRSARLPLFEMLEARVRTARPELVREAWRQEFLINPVLVDDEALGLLPSQIGCEISYAVPRSLTLAGMLRPGLKRVRPDYILVSQTTDAIAAVIEAKLALLAGVDGDSIRQMLVEQLVAESSIGVLSDGIAWRVYRRGNLEFAAESPADLGANIKALRELIGRDAVDGAGTGLLPMRFVATPSETAPVGSAAVSDVLRHAFPKLDRSELTLLAPADPRYNSFSWAAADLNRWWSPDIASPLGYWPGALRGSTLDSVVQAFETLEYRVDGSPSRSALIGAEQVALFGSDSDVRHASRRLDRDLWSSKLGAAELISHKLDAVAGELYGDVMAILSRVPTASRR